jgi:hypothetical protein
MGFFGDYKILKRLFQNELLCRNYTRKMLHIKFYFQNIYIESIMKIIDNLQVNLSKHFIYFWCIDTVVLLSQMNCFLFSFFVVASLDRRCHNNV